MATATLNPALEQLRGETDDMVFRHVGGKLVVSRAPDFSRRKLSLKQKAQIQRFKEAVHHARSVLGDPKRRLASATESKRGSVPRPGMGALIKDYLKAQPK